MGAQKDRLSETVLLSTHNLVLITSASNEGSDSSEPFLLTYTKYGLEVEEGSNQNS